ncbi:hypothetical protein N8I77_006956 [Diaporthe amygdali]|uniref:Uncharacterized protein n=1 Tax=Phomopsis amygdali TaxID=1214568 RepID=A0AAD9SJ69_PHOAM|nr:hypothetical protein N8I77_006956 [Diaporthe amygdali]
MLFKTTISLLLATLAAAAPNKRQSEPIRVSLTNTILAVTEEFNASMDGTAVPVDSTFFFDLAVVECIELCVPEFHCTLHDKNFTPFISLPPWTTTIDPAQQVGLIICGFGLPDTKREVQSAAAEARATEPYAGAAVFSNNQTGWSTGFGYYLGQTVSLAERTGYYTGATVQDVTTPPGERWICEAFDVNGGSLGNFAASDRFIYSFVPGVVGSFVCQ